MSRLSKMLPPVQPVDVPTESRVSDLLRGVGKTAFQGKNLSLAVQVWIVVRAEQKKFLRQGKISHNRK